MANQISSAAREYMVTKLGCLALKPGQSSDEVGKRPIEVGNYDVRAFTTLHVRDVMEAFRKVEANAWNGRVELGLGVPNGFPESSTDLNFIQAKKGTISQQEGIVAAFNSADRAPYPQAPPQFSAMSAPIFLYVVLLLWHGIRDLSSRLLWASWPFGRSLVLRMWFFLSSIFFEITIQQAAAYVDREIVSQIHCFIVNEYASAVPPILVKRAADLFSKLAAEPDLLNHTSKRKVVGARASVEAPVAAGYGDGTDIADEMLFAVQIIADPNTDGGHCFIGESYAAKLAEIS